MCYVPHSCRQKKGSTKTDRDALTHGPQAIRNGKWLKGVKRRVDPGFDLFTGWPQHAQRGCLHAACTIPHSFNKSPLVLDQKLLPLFFLWLLFALTSLQVNRNHYIVGDVNWCTREERSSIPHPAVPLLPVRVVSVCFCPLLRRACFVQNAVSTPRRERRFPFNV